MLSIVALMLVALVGGAGAFWAYKKYKQEKEKENQEYRIEGSLGKAKEGFDAKMFKDLVLDDVTLSATVKKHQLVSAWGVADENAAKAQLQEKFTVYVKDGEVRVTYQDKDKDLVKSILTTILAIHKERRNGQSAPSGPTL